MELESTRVGIGIPRIRLEVSWSIKEFRLERVDALRGSSIVAPIRSMQPWSGARAEGLLPNFLPLWQWSCCLELCLLSRCELLWQQSLNNHWQCHQTCHRRGTDYCLCDAVSLPG